MKTNMYLFKIKNFVGKYMLIIALVLGFFISILASSVMFIAKCDSISDKVLRLHILANSDSEEDQQLKLKVRDEIVLKSGNLFSQTKNLEDALILSNENVDSISEVAKDTVKKYGYNYNISTEITNMYFSTRHYDNITMPAGNYNAIRVVIGEGKGKNWWCVVFPSICLKASEKSNNTEDKLSEVLDSDELDIVEGYDKYEFKFKLLEWLNFGRD